jgi:hypothetical protein
MLLARAMAYLATDFRRSMFMRADILDMFGVAGSTLASDFLGSRNAEYCEQ